MDTLIPKYIKYIVKKPQLRLYRYDTVCIHVAIIKIKNK